MIAAAHDNVLSALKSVNFQSDDSERRILEAWSKPYPTTLRARGIAAFDEETVMPVKCTDSETGHTQVKRVSTFRGKSRGGDRKFAEIFLNP